MKVSEIMERLRMTQTGLAVAYIEDGLDEIARKIDDNIQSSKVDIVGGTREYSFPDGMVRLRNVFIKNSDGDYQQIPRLTHGPGIEK